MPLCLAAGRVVWFQAAGRFAAAAKLVSLGFTERRGARTSGITFACMTARRKRRMADSAGSFSPTTICTGPPNHPEERSGWETC